MENSSELSDPSIDVVTLETPDMTSLLTSSSGTLQMDYPSTAEIMQKCLTFNPFDLRFREENRRISQCNEELFEQNGLVPVSLSLPHTAGVTLLKLPSSLPHSPGIFSNINFLSTNFDSDNLKSADWSRLVQQMKDNGGLSSQTSRMDDSGQAPRTADVLNAVLDMNSDRFGSFGCLGTSGMSSCIDNQLGTIMSSPISLPVLATSEALAAITVASTSSGVRTMVERPPSLLSCSPCSSDSASISLQPLISGINSSRCSSAVITKPHCSNSGQRTSKKRLLCSTNSSSNNTGDPRFLSRILLSNNVQDPGEAISLENSSSVSQSLESENWESLDVKPAVTGKSTSTALQLGVQYFENEEEVYHPSERSLKTQEVPSVNSRSDESSVSQQAADKDVSHRSGRGRGRSTITADLPTDERRVTILERNKAAAVRYRKRKKEEHDEIITRVRVLEQENASLSTQNQVLRRELDRISALLKAREVCCVCRLSGAGECNRAESPIETDALPLQQSSDLQAFVSRQLMSSISSNDKSPE